MSVPIELANERFNKNIDKVERIITKKISKNNRMYEDLYQELLLALWDACINYDGIVYFQTYAYNKLIYKFSMALSMYIGFSKKGIIEYPSESYRIEDHVINHVLLELLYNEAINKLNDRHKFIVNKVFLEDFNYTELSKLLKCSSAIPSNACKKFRREFNRSIAIHRLLNWKEEICKW